MVLQAQYLDVDLDKITEAIELRTRIKLIMDLLERPQLFLQELNELKENE